MNMVGSELYHDSEIQSNESNPVGTVLLVAHSWIHTVDLGRCHSQPARCHCCGSPLLSNDLIFFVAHFLQVSDLGFGAWLAKSKL